MRLAGAIAAALVAALSLGGCDDGAPAHGIVVTTNILGDIVTEIVGSEVPVTVLMPPNADPHAFGISPSQASDLQAAALVVFNGFGLEAGVLHHVEAAADAGAATLEVAAEVLEPGERDPHLWTDPAHVVAAIDVIAAAIIEAVPAADAEVIREQAAGYARQVRELDAELTDALAAIPAGRRSLVTNHHVFGYFADAYRLDVIGVVIPGGSTLASPSAADLASLVDAIRAHDVRAIFVEASHPDRLARALVHEAGLEVEIRTLYSESLGPRGSEADTYLRMMRFNADQIVAGLTGDSP